MTLFKHHADNKLKRYAPLAARMRPSSFDEFLGQEHVIGPGRVLRNSINADQIPSMVLWGPAGSGKTTLALLIASVTGCHFEQLSAVTSGVKAIREVVASARDRLGESSRRTILFIDEIHRFSKSQQDALLPHVEDGTITLIGATTENPSFEIISPLLSRTRVYTLEPLSDTNLGEIIDRAISDKDHGLGHEKISLVEDARHFLLRVANGDARSALNTLELAIESTKTDSSGQKYVTVKTVEESVQKQSRYDRLGDMHYDTISAFIKSIRASDPDAALYYLARMIDAGEDAVFIARRLVISAAEDIGLAEPNGLMVAMAAQQAVNFVGMPEGRIPLAEATIYLACSPKSNSAYKAIDKALKLVRSSRDEPIPNHLRNAPTTLMQNLGYGEDYEYPHDKPDHFLKSINLPEAIKNHQFYEPGNLGAEKVARQRLFEWWGNHDKDK